MRVRLAFAAVLVLLLKSAAAAADSPLSSGVNFPDLSGKSLSGSDVVVGMRDGLPKVLVITFTRAAATPAQRWLEACRGDETAKPKAPAVAPDPTGDPSGAPPGVACYDVRMAQDVPRVIRGFIEGRMKKGLSREQLARTVLIYNDKEAWRDRLLVMHQNEDEPFVVMVDRQGRVQSMLQGAFNPGALKAEQAKLVAN